MSRHLLVLLFLGNVFNLEAAPPADEREADRIALRQLGANYEQAINQGDLTSLAQSVAPEMSAVFSTNDEVKGLDAMQNYFLEIKKRLGTGSSYTVKIKPDHTQFFGDVALAHGKSDEVARLGNGREFRFPTHWTAILRKEGGAWKAERLHVSMNPLDNPIIHAQQQQRTWWAVGLGTIACFLAFVFGRKSKRSIAPANTTSLPPTR